MLCSDSKNFKLEMKDFNLLSFLDHIEDIISKQLKSPNVTFRVVRDSNLPAVLYSDSQRLE